MTNTSLRIAEGRPAELENGDDGRSPALAVLLEACRSRREFAVDDAERRGMYLKTKEIFFGKDGMRDGREASC